MIDAELLARNIGIIAEAILAREKPEPAQTNQVACRNAARSLRTMIYASFVQRMERYTYNGHTMENLWITWYIGCRYQRFRTEIL